MGSDNGMALAWILGVVGGLGSIVVTAWIVFVCNQESFPWWWGSPSS
jgi:hypothetical protein